MTTAYATKRSLWRLCAEYIKMPPMRDTDFIRLTPDSFLLRWDAVDGEGIIRADYCYWAGHPLLHINIVDWDGHMRDYDKIPSEALIAGLGMKKVSA